MTGKDVNAVIHAVAKGTPEEQLEAVHILSAAADRKAAPVLMEVLGKGPGPLHQAAARALGRIQDPSVAPGLLALYKRYAGRADPVNGDFTRHVLDAWSLLEPDEGKRAALFIEVLETATAVEARSSMAWRLERVKHPQRIPALLAGARKREPRMQWAAVEVLGSIARQTPGDARSQIVVALVELLKDDPDRTVRGHAASALRNVPHEAVAPALVAALKDVNPFVRIAAAQSLAWSGDREAIPALDAFAKAAEREIEADAAKRAIDRIKKRQP